MIVFFNMDCSRSESMFMCASMSTGAGGIWRIAAINEAGGWKDRTLVEDTDLSVRVGLKGWKFVYAGSIEVIIVFYLCHESMYTSFLQQLF